eukprot:c18141_g1_i1 orf=281-1864(+)
MDDPMIEESAADPSSDSRRSRACVSLPDGVSLRLDTTTAASPNPNPSPIPNPFSDLTPNSYLTSSPLKQQSGSGLSTPSPSHTSYSDRFIPSRAGSNLSSFALLERSPSGACSTPLNDGREDGAAAYSMLLRTEIFGADMAGPLSPSTPEKLTTARELKYPPMSPSKNIFRFKTDLRCSGASNAKPESPFSLSPVGVDGALAGTMSSPKKAPRKIPRSPYKVLDAPALQDDFYLNLVDWSSHNVLSVGLGTCVYLWSACTSKVTKLCDLGPDDTVCSVGWTQRGTYLAVGTNLGEVQIWDALRCKKVRTMGGHRTRVGTLAWSSHVLSSGSRDRSILQRDVRVQEDFVSKLTGHKSEVCGLKWSYDDRELASGGNDNQLFVWGQQGTQPMLKFSEHTAAVKAIAWSPHQHGLLASGGGTADRCIRFWNTATSSHLNCVDTGSQATLDLCLDVVVADGFFDSAVFVQLATLTGHTFRVLYLAISPDGQTIVTGAGDETLRFWTVFPSPKSQNNAQDNGILSLGRTHIR